MDQVADGWPGNLAIDPKSQLDQIALGGAGEGGKPLVGLDLGVGVAAAGEDGGRSVHLAGDIESAREQSHRRAVLSLMLDEKPHVIAGVHTRLASA